MNRAIFFLVTALTVVVVAAGCSNVSSIEDGGTGEDIDCTQGEYNDDFELLEQSDVATLAGYTSISGELWIECPTCTDLSELICLVSVGEDLKIRNNDALTSLEGLSALTSVGGDLGISVNDALINLDGLSDLTSVGDELEIYYNGILPDCEVCGLLDQLTTAPTSIDVYDNLDDSCTPVPANCP